MPKLNTPPSPLTAAERRQRAEERLRERHPETRYAISAGIIENKVQLTII